MCRLELREPPEPAPARAARVYRSPLRLTGGFHPALAARSGSRSPDSTLPVRCSVPPCHSDAVAHGRGAPRDTCAHPSSPPRPARTPAPCFEAEAGGSLDQPRSRKGPVAPFQTILCFSLFWLGSRTHYPLIVASAQHRLGVRGHPIRFPCFRAQKRCLSSCPKGLGRALRKTSNHPRGRPFSDFSGRLQNPTVALEDLFASELHDRIGFSDF